MNSSVVRLAINTCRILSVVGVLRAMENGWDFSPSADTHPENKQDGIVSKWDFYISDEDFEHVIEDRAQGVRDVTDAEGVLWHAEFGSELLLGVQDASLPSWLARDHVRAGPARLAFDEIVVRDHGPGIDEEELERMTDRFWRGERTRDKPGTGLGLAIASDLLASAGGQLRVETVEPRGLRVTLRFTAGSAGVPVAAGVTGAAGDAR